MAILHHDASHCDGFLTTLYMVMRSDEEGDVYFMKEDGAGLIYCYE